MFSLSFTPNPAFVDNYARSYVANTVVYLKSVDPCFSVNIRGRVYGLRFEISDCGEVSIYSESGTVPISLTTPTLQLNIGSLLLPEFIDLGMPVQPSQARGLNPDAQQTPCYESGAEGEPFLPKSEADTIMAEINKIGFLNIIRKKSASS